MKIQPIYVKVFCAYQNPELTNEFMRFRKSLFIDQLGWELEPVGQSEIDQFDCSHTVYCILQSDSKIVGGFRAIRTDFPYLAETIFPNLATTRPFPKRVDYWEISRFGVTPQFMPGRLSLLNYAAMFEFARMHKVKSLVALIDIHHERFLRNKGIRTKRYGVPANIGMDSKGQIIEGVVGEIPFQEQQKEQLNRFFKLAKHMEISDDTLILGRKSFSA